jgi:dihydrofolate reductase
MRKILMFNRVTPEGFFAGPDRNLDWAVPDPELDKAATQGMPGAGTMLLGRRTYQMFESFWPHVLDDSPTAPDPHGPDRRSPEIRAMATFINEATKVVFSKTLQEVTWRNSRLLHELDPSEIGAMKEESGNDMIVLGSGSIVSQLTQHGLIDEYQFVVSPTLLGSGQPLFSGVSKGSGLELLDAKAFPSGNVMLRYASA